MAIRVGERMFRPMTAEVDKMRLAVLPIAPVPTFLSLPISGGHYLTISLSFDVNIY